MAVRRDPGVEHRGGFDAASSAAARVSSTLPAKRTSRHSGAPSRPDRSAVRPGWAGGASSRSGDPVRAPRRAMPVGLRLACSARSRACSSRMDCSAAVVWANTDSTVGASGSPNVSMATLRASSAPAWPSRPAHRRSRPPTAPVRPGHRRGPPSPHRPRTARLARRRSPPPAPGRAPAWPDPGRARLSGAPAARPVPSGRPPAGR